MKSKNERKAAFLRYVHDQVDYWDREKGKSQKERLDSLAFSILVALDGEAGALPGGFEVLPLEPKQSRTPADIAGGLHDDYYSYEPEEGEGKN